MFDNKYPYTDFSQLNLDWFLNKFKELLEEQERVSGKVKDLDDTVKEFTDFVTNYFDNLDVQAEVNVKLNEMAADGTLSDLLAPLVSADIGDVVADQIGAVVDDQIGAVVGDQIDAVVADQIDAAVAPKVPGAVTDWLDANVSPTGTVVAIDSSLTIQGAAADAKATGDKIDELKNAFIAVQIDELPITIIENEFITHDGEIEQYQGWSRTNYIPVKKYESITASCNPASSYNMFYDRTYTKIGTYFSVYATDTELQIPENAAFVIFSNTTSGMENFTAKVKLKEETEFENVNNKLSNNILTTSKIVSANSNILDPNNFKLAGYIDSQDGETFISNTSYICTNDFIDVPFGTEAIVAKFPQTENSQRICCFLLYDAFERYMGYYAGYFDGYDYKKYIIGNDTDVAKFKFWCNKTTVSDGSNEVCLAFNNIDEFISFAPVNELNNDELETPEIYLPLKGKKIVNFGDSIFGNKKAPFSISYALSENTGAVVYNIGFGGCDMAARTSADWDAFSMYRLAYAIANNDFSLQNAVDIDNVPGMPLYFKDTLALLETIDFDEIDIITIAYGTNDFTGEVLIDNDNNLVDTGTFKGALRYSLQQIMTAYPHIKIFVCGQTYRFWLDGNNNFLYDSDTHENGNNDKLTDFVEATKAVSEAYHIPFIDNYYELGINYYNRSYYFPTNDGTHQNYHGAKLIADHIKHELF